MISCIVQLNYIAWTVLYYICPCLKESEFLWNRFLPKTLFSYDSITRDSVSGFYGYPPSSLMLLVFLRHHSTAPSPLPPLFATYPLMFVCVLDAAARYYDIGLLLFSCMAAETAVYTRNCSCSSCCSRLTVIYAKWLSIKSNFSQIEILCIRCTVLVSSPSPSLLWSKYGDLFRYAKVTMRKSVQNKLQNIWNSNIFHTY